MPIADKPPMIGETRSTSDYRREAKALRRRYAASLAVIITALGALFLISEIADRHRDAYRVVEARIGTEIVATAAIARLSQRLEDEVAGYAAAKSAIRAAIAREIERLETVGICRADGAGGWIATGALDETWADPRDDGAPSCAQLAQLAADAQIVAEDGPDQAAARRRIADALAPLEARLIEIDDLRSAEGELWDDRHSLIWRATVALMAAMLLLQSRFVFTRGLDKLGIAHGRLDLAADGLRRSYDKLAEARNALAGALAASEGARAEAEAARRAEAAASALKTEFLARLSHEVRTPLNALLGFTALMDAEPRSAEDHARLARMREAGATLMAQFDDMIELSRICAGEFRAETTAFEPRALAQAQLDAVAEAAAARGVTFTLAVAPEAEGRFAGDARRIGRALLALVDNATRHGGGAVRVDVDIWPKAGLRFAVSDEGPGVPEAQREVIFAPFEQSDGSATRLVGGLGIGLALARETARALGGSLGVGEAEGGGARFWFEARAQRIAGPAVSIARDAPSRIETR